MRFCLSTVTRSVWWIEELVNSLTKNRLDLNGESRAGATCGPQIRQYLRYAPVEPFAFRPCQRIINGNDEFLAHPLLPQPDPPRTSAGRMLGSS